MDWTHVKARLRSPWLWAGLAALVYKVLVGVFHLQIDPTAWNEFINILSYIFLGVGIFDSTKKLPDADPGPDVKKYDI